MYLSGAILQKKLKTGDKQKIWVSSHDMLSEKRNFLGHGVESAAQVP